MPAKEVTIALPLVIGSVLDADNDITATSTASVLGDRTVLIGTSEGSVLLCAPVNESAHVLTPHSDTTLHCGAIYDLAVSSHHLVATAGHDAVSCVFPLHTLYQDGGVTQCRRIMGHTVPVVAVRFLSDGISLVTLGADGHVLVVEVHSGAVLASVSCGFAAACLAFSLDETQLFVGGRSLASIDLHHAMRPISLQSVAGSASGPDPWASLSSAAAAPDAAAALHTPAWLRLYAWEEKLESTAGVSRWQHRTPPHTFIRSLDVNSHDGALTAIFVRHASDTASVELCGSARWAATGGRTSSEATWDPQALRGVSTALRYHMRRDGSTGVAPGKLRVRHRVRASTRPCAKHTHAPSGSFSSNAAALWNGHWYASPFELAGGTPRLTASHGLAEVATLATQQNSQYVFPSSGPRTSGEELLIAQAQCDELQRECDALVFQIKTFLAHKAPIRSS
ncbi:hypothetical protein, conserved [Leishmania tarentolae]|uniref:Uncharacterized protein n=1 Tax=Leishmania tarentolae TaxID=5689 RepID=A0A640KDZ5_LEITA|nr:hypothetical protein, conserved [Leishmania tarentolae]